MTVMTIYRIYILSTESRMVEAASVAVFEDDDAVIQHATALAQGREVEVRDADRLVLRIPPSG
jgi:hypothetical protein